MGIRLVAGRDVSSRDGAASPPVVVINQAMARLLWPSLSTREVLGRRVDALSPRRAEPHYMEVVGVVANVKESGLEQADEPLLYIPFEQAPALLWPLLQRSLVLIVRSVNPATDPAVLTRPVRAAVATFDSSLPIADARPMPGVLETSLARARMNTLLLSLLGGIAFVLATVGIYGVVSYFVTKRTHENGVRMALVASPGRVWKFVVGRALTPMALGFAVGVPLSLVTTKVIEGQLYGVNGHDPATLSSVGVLLLVVGVLAAYVPARRAMRVPPVVALNEA
jgi:ABC-type lipoprotein release transport system permease subunit